MTFEDNLLDKIKEILKSIDDFVQKNKGEDQEKYGHACLKMGEYEVSYNFSRPGIVITNERYDSNQGKRIGERIEFSELFGSAYIFIKINNIDDSTKWIKYEFKNPIGLKKEKNLLDDLELIEVKVGEPKKAAKKEELTNAVMKMKNLISSLKYDSERTHHFENLTEEARKKIYLEELKKANERGEEFLPSVISAVNRWAEELKRFNDKLQKDGLATKITEEQMTTFKLSLAKIVSEKLSKGNSLVQISSASPNDILFKAAEISGIELHTLPSQTSIVVTIYSAEYIQEGETIYPQSQVGKEEKPKTK